MAPAGPDRDMANVSDEDYARGMRLCDMMGEQVVRALDERKGNGGGSRPEAKERRTSTSSGENRVDVRAGTVPAFLTEHFGRLVTKW